MRCKQSVKRNKNIGIFTGELPCNLNLRVKVLTEIELVLGRKQELLHHNDFCICLCLDRFKNRAISFFKLGVVEPLSRIGSVPCVVDADKNRNNIRLNVDKIRLQPVNKINRLIAADSEVNKFKINLREFFFQKSCRILRVSVAEVMRIFTVTVGIGNAVALKQNLHIKSSVLTFFILSKYLSPQTEIKTFFSLKHENFFSYFSKKFS